MSLQCVVHHVVNDAIVACKSMGLHFSDRDCCNALDDDRAGTVEIARPADALVHTGQSQIATYVMNDSNMTAAVDNNGHAINVEGHIVMLIQHGTTEDMNHSLRQRRFSPCGTCSKLLGVTYGTAISAFKRPDVEISCKQCRSSSCQMNAQMDIDWYIQLTRLIAYNKVADLRVPFSINHGCDCRQVHLFTCKMARAIRMAIKCRRYFRTNNNITLQESHKLTCCIYSTLEDNDFQTEWEAMNNYPSSCYRCTVWGLECVVNLTTVNGSTTTHAQIHNRHIVQEDTGLFFLFLYLKMPCNEGMSPTTPLLQYIADHLLVDAVTACKSMGLRFSDDLHLNPDSLEDNVIETDQHTDVHTPGIGQNEHIPPTVTSTNDDTSILQHIPHFGICFPLNIDWATEDTQVSHMERQSVVSNTQMSMLHVQGAVCVLRRINHASPMYLLIYINACIWQLVVNGAQSGAVLGNELFQTEWEVANGYPSLCYNCTRWGFDCVINLIVVDGVTPGIVSKCMYCFKNGIQCVSFALHNK
ncbi:hypothetical protein C8Q80DRAFT_1122978 [Daedaleopsis nitida]|nr:hypothetical protein C8Q80DRAFT_1122978 [Daedaleopsis nitida]